MSECLQPRWTVACQAPCPWDSPGRNTGVGNHSLPGPGVKPRSPALQAGSLLLCHLGSYLKFLGNQGYFGEYGTNRQSDKKKGSSPIRRPFRDTLLLDSTPYSARAGLSWIPYQRSGPHELLKLKLSPSPSQVVHINQFPREDLGLCPARSGQFSNEPLDD